MMKKVTAKKVGIFLMFTYFISYITRINYGAVIVEMVKSTGFSKSELSLAVTASFFTYGLGQIVCGWLGDRFQPRTMIFMGLVITSCMNISMIFCPYYQLMALLWGVNGFAQAFMWPPIVRLMVSLLTTDEYKKASLIVSWGSSLGTISIYLLAPLFISVSGYKLVFAFSALCAIIMIPIWLTICPILSDKSQESKSAVVVKKNVSFTKLIFNPLMIGIMIAIVLQGSLRDGIATWMPSYIAETYDLGSNIAILTGVILPIFSIICMYASEALHEHLLTDPIKCGCVIFAVSTLSAVLLLIFTGNSTIISVFSMGLLSGCMHGVNFMLICIVPAYFKTSGHISLISGVLNACTYIGSAVSTYGIALLTDNFGWKPTIFVWFIIALMGTLICLASIPGWKKRFAKG